MLIIRNPADGSASNVDSNFSNPGRALMEGVDLQFNWARTLAAGGFSINSVANYNLQVRVRRTGRICRSTIDAGFNDCSLQIQCQRYDYRIFTTYSYFQRRLERVAQASVLAGAQGRGLPAGFDHYGLPLRQLPDLRTCSR